MLLLVVLSSCAARRGGTAPTEEQAESTAAVDRAHRMSQLDETGAALLRSIGLSPNNLSEHDMATLEHAYSRVVTAPDEATAAFEAVRAANPGHPTVLSLAAVLADAKGDPLKAIELQEAALLVDPDVIGLQQGLADFYLRAGRIAAGRVVLDKIIATPSATPAERQRAQKQQQNEVPRRMGEVSIQGKLRTNPNPSPSPSPSPNPNPNPNPKGPDQGTRGGRPRRGCAAPPRAGGAASGRADASAGEPCRPL